MMDEIKVVSEIVYLHPDWLTPWEKNARRHTQDDIDGIKKSIIAAGGFRDPIGVWGDQNIIVEGHGRWIAAKEMGLERVPCVRLDHMTDEQRRRYTIEHNRTAEFSSWDYEKLEQEIAALMIAGTDMSDLKFSLDHLGKDEIDQEVQDAVSAKKHICPRCGHEWE